jgi:hypothetical protein
MIVLRSIAILCPRFVAGPTAVRNFAAMRNLDRAIASGIILESRRP